MEYRVLGTEDARQELQWLISSDSAAPPLHSQCPLTDSERRRTVDTLCVVWPAFPEGSQPLLLGLVLQILFPSPG